MSQADWYFDFVSPFAYLQSSRLAEISRHVDVKPNPVLFAALLDHHGQLGPAEIGPKREFIFRQALWLARRYGIEMKLPPVHPFNPLPPLRLALALDCRLDAIQAIFDFVWKEGRDIGEPAAWEEITRRLGVTNVDELIGSAPIKQALRRATDDAIARGVFGVPTLIVDNEVFWGFDSTDFLLEYLCDPVALRGLTFDPVRKLAHGAARRRRNSS